MHDMIEIGDPATRADWLHEQLARKRKIMGFGHRVYKNGDSRVPTMKAALDTRRRDPRRPDAGSRCTTRSKPRCIERKASSRTSTTRPARRTT